MRSPAVIGHHAHDVVGVTIIGKTPEAEEYRVTNSGEADALVTTGGLRDLLRGLLQLVP